MSLRAKLFVFSLAISILPLTAMGWYSVREASESLQRQSLVQLASLRDAKVEAVTALFDRWRDEAVLFARTKEVYHSLGLMRDMALDTPDGERMDIAAPEIADSLNYVGPTYAPFVEQLGFEDALVAGDDGRVYYSHQRGPELGEDMVRGELLRDSALRKAFDLALQGGVVFTDIAPHPALDNAPAAFVAAPVLDHNGEVDGVALLRLPLDDLNKTMAQTEGESSQGAGAAKADVILIGKDGTMRSDSRRDQAHHSVAGSLAAPEQGRVRTEAATLAANGGKGVVLAPDFRGESSLTAYTNLNLHGLQWRLLAEIDAERAFASVSRLRWAALLVGLAVICATVLAAWYFNVREIGRPLAALRGYAERVAGGDLEARAQGRFGPELARVVAAIADMVETLKERFAEANDQAALASKRSEEAEHARDEAEHAREAAGALSAALQHEVASLSEILQRMATGDLAVHYAPGAGGHAEAKTLFLRIEQALAGTLDELGRTLASVRGDAEHLASASEEFSQVAATMARNAAHMAHGAGEADAAMRDITMNVSSMAAATEEISANITTVSSTAEEMAQAMTSLAANVEDLRRTTADIADNAKAGSEVARTATDMATDATSAMSELGRAARDIGKVTAVIKRIAEQTNLLALNATIEAASAGEAGRGFAVVAGEIKELAGQSAEAAADIATKIRGVQHIASEAIRAMGSMTEIIGTINSAVAEISEATKAQNQGADQIAASVTQSGYGVNDIAASIAELAATANDISRRAGETAHAIESMADTVHAVRAASESGNQGADQINASASDLAAMAAGLTTLVRGFRIADSALAGEKVDSEEDAA